MDPATIAALGALITTIANAVFGWMDRKKKAAENTRQNVEITSKVEEVKKATDGLIKDNLVVAERRGEATGREQGAAAAGAVTAAVVSTRPHGKP